MTGALYLAHNIMPVYHKLVTLRQALGRQNYYWSHFTCTLVEMVDAHEGCSMLHQQILHLSYATQSSVDAAVPISQ